MLDLKFLGAIKDVTGSKTLFTFKGKKYLVDCGLTQSEESSAKNLLQDLPPEVDPKMLSAIFLTHAHVDHSGLLPRLVRKGLRAPIYCTQETSELIIPLLEDSAKIHVEALRRLREHDPHHRATMPLYDLQDVANLKKLLRVVKFAEPQHHGELEFTLYPNAHILGSALVRFETKPSLIFSGDLGRFDSILEKAPEMKPKAADIVVLEGTYGDRLHRPDALEKLERILKKAREKESIIIMAAFALARTQTLLLLLHRLMEKNSKLELPIYLDGPLAIKMTDIYRHHSEALSPDAAELEAAFKRVKMVEFISQREAITAGKKSPPFIIIAASGMVSGGRIMENLKAFGPSTHSIFVLTGFQAPGTLGARIEAGERQLRFRTLQGVETMELAADVEVLHGLSAHADQKDLLAWAQILSTPTAEIFLNHGEEMARETLASELERVHKGRVTVLRMDRNHFHWDESSNIN